MALRKECAVCHKKYMGALHSNYVKLYNDAIVRLDRLPQNVERELVPEDSYVCKHCAEIVTAVKCGMGKECKYSTVSYMRDYLFGCDTNEINTEWFETGIIEKGRISEFLKACGLAADAKRVSEHPYWICNDCSLEFVEKAIKKLEESVNVDALNLFLKVPVAHKDGYCSRCGQKIKYDFAPIVSKFYECESWEPQDLAGSSIWDLISSTAKTFFKKGHLCHKCVPFLLPENVNLYVQYMCDKGWQGVLSSATSLRSTFKNEVKVTTMEHCESKSELTAFLQMQAISLGANALVNFHCERHVRWQGDDMPDKISYTGGAMPIRVNSTQAKQQKELKSIGIVVDGSNMIRFNDGNHVGGLIAFVREMKKRKATTKVFLDANIMHVLDDAGETKARQCLEGEIKKSKTVYAIVPAGSRADDFILQHADRTGATIVSNDRYLQYVDRYAWIKDGRVAHFMFDDKRLMIPDLGIDIAARGGHD